MSFLLEFSSIKHKSKMTSDCCVFKFLQCSVYGKHFVVDCFTSTDFIFQYITRVISQKQVPVLLPHYPGWYLVQRPPASLTENIQMESCGYHLSGGGHTPNGNYNPPPPPPPPKQTKKEGVFLWKTNKTFVGGGGGVGGGGYSYRSVYVLLLKDDTHMTPFECVH